MTPAAYGSQSPSSDSDMTPVILVPTHKELRCPDCNHLLAKGELAPGTRMQFKCPRAGCRRTVSFAHL